MHSDAISVLPGEELNLASNPVYRYEFRKLSHFRIARHPIQVLPSPASSDDTECALILSVGDVMAPVLSVSDFGAGFFPLPRHVRHS